MVIHIKKESNMKTICICEKPSVARSIARVLGVTEKQEGYLSGNGYAVT